MKIRKILKDSLICLAVLGMIGGSLNSNVNAKRHYHHYRHSRKAKRIVYKYGYYKHHRFHYYKSGYYRNGKWIRHKAKKYSNDHKAKHYKYSYIQDNDDYGNMHYIPVKVLRKGSFVSICKINNKGYLNSVTKSYRNYLKKHGYITNIRTAALTSHIPSMKHHYFVKHHYSHHNSVAQNLAEMKSQTVKDINKDREQNGLSPLQETPILDQIANMRAKQELKVQGHIDPSTGNSYDDEDGYKLGDNPTPSNEKYGENLADTALNIEETRPNDGTSYYDKNGKEAANDVNDSLMNHDTSSDPSTNWGHRDNILHSGYNNVGVGTSHKNNTYYIVEDFD